jgi:D-proline reductase (dithiol) PrdB
MASLTLLIDRLGARLFAAFPVLQRRWARRHAVVSIDVPWAPLVKPLSACRVALVTTGGVHLDSDPPFDLASRDGDPTVRRIPADVEPRRLRISHSHYDTRDAERDVNVLFPIERLRELAAEGRIGGVAPTHYSFGWIRAVDPLVRETAPLVARELLEAGVDAVVLTPA